MKYIAALFILLSANANAGYISVSGTPDGINAYSGYGGYPLRAGIQQYNNRSIKKELLPEINYVAVKLALTDDFFWIDGPNTYTYNTPADGDFRVNYFINDVLVATHDFRNPSDNFFSFTYANSEPLHITSSSDFYEFIFEIEALDDLGNPLSSDVTFGVDYKNTLLYISEDTALGYVPEPETFALFLLGAVVLCARRQIKANATLPV